MKIHFICIIVLSMLNGVATNATNFQPDEIASYSGTRRSVPTDLRHQGRYNTRNSLRALRNDGHNAEENEDIHVGKEMLCEHCGKKYLRAGCKRKHEEICSFKEEPCRNEANPKFDCNQSFVDEDLEKKEATILHNVCLTLLEVLNNIVTDATHPLSLQLDEIASGSGTGRLVPIDVRKIIMELDCIRITLLSILNKEATNATNPLSLQSDENASCSEAGGSVPADTIKIAMMLQPICDTMVSMLSAVETSVTQPLSLQLDEIASCSGTRRSVPTDVRQMLDVHNEKGNYSCALCGLKFIRNEDARDHEDCCVGELDQYR